MRSRNQYFDFLRGTAIIMVIGIHTVPSVKNWDTFDEIVTIITRQLLNCAVPLFLAISGYFIAKKDLSSKKNILSFWKKQIPTVYIPCLIWSMGWLFFDFISNGTSNLILNLLRLLCCGYSVYYFIALIIQLYVVTPLLLRINKIGGVILSAAVSGVSIMIVTYMMQIEGKSYPLLIYAGPFVLWVIFFMMGVWFSHHSRNYSLSFAWIIAAMGLVASVVESFYYLSLHGSGLGIKPSSFIYSAGIVMLLLSSKAEKAYRENIITRCVLFVGEISFSIYFIHMYVRIGLHHILSTDIWFINWALTLLITIIFILIAKKLLPNTFLKKYLAIR